MANMGKDEFLCVTIEVTKYLNQNPDANIREEKEWGIEFLVHNKVKDTIEGHMAMLRQNHMAGCLPCNNVTA